MGFILQNIALGLLFICNIGAIWLALRAAARVARLRKATETLDWEAVANLTGDIGGIRRTIQKLNNRINGMEKVGSGTQANALALIEEAKSRPQNNGYYGASG
jgi:cbb3-type cytochrome oxidase subunit 3